MSNLKIVSLTVLGAVFLVLGLYYRIFDPANSIISYEYLGLGTWIGGLIYYTLFQKHKEVMSLVLGLLVLHSGVILIIASNLKLLGLLVFTAGIIGVLNSGFSEYMKKRRIKKMMLLEVFIFLHRL